MYYFFFFFFSSRRRHTRCYRDWSSDVCSSDLQLREVFQDTFGPESRLPACARRFYELHRRPEGMSPERKQTWDRALSQVDSPRLGALAAAFEQLVQQSPEDATAWYNLAVVQA